MKGSSKILTEDLATFRHNLLPIPEFGLQAAFNMYGFPSGSVIDIIAPDGIGKSSLMFTIMGWFMRQGVPAYYVETENKLMAPERIKRCLHTDRKLADNLYRRLIWDQCFDIQSAVRSIESFIIKSRDPESEIYIPPTTPIVIGLDTWSKLMSSDEAEGVMEYEGGDVKESKEVGGGSNLGSAKAAQAWMRRLPFFQRRHNVLFVFTRHQNDKIDMSAGRFGGGSLSSATDSYNRTSRGGRAFNQNAALQIILSRLKGVTAKIGGVDTRVATLGRITVCKNSYGPDGTKFDYHIVAVPRKDTETYQEPALSFSFGTAQFILARKLLTMTSKNFNCYSCKELDVTDVSADEFSSALHARPDLLDKLGSQLEIFGYKSPDTSIPIVSSPEELVAEDEGKETDAPAQQ